MSTTAASTETRFAASADGTRIGYECRGSGPALVLVDGALCQRAMGPSRDLAAALADRFTTICYDRRGRGESGAGESPYSTEREVEDLAAVLAAVLAEVGGRAHLFGSSSGGLLALAGARAGLPVDRLVAYEVPMIVDDTRAATPSDLPERVAAMVARGDRGRAVKTFLRLVGAPAPMVALMPALPVWRKLTAVAHTLPYDLELVAPVQQGRPVDPDLAAVGTPTLVLVGGRSPAYLKNAQVALADALPHGILQELPGQTHMIKAKATAPAVAAFLRG